jgi:hypothetical protein
MRKEKKEMKETGSTKVELKIKGLNIHKRSKNKGNNAG